MKRSLIYGVIAAAIAAAIGIYLYMLPQAGASGSGFDTFNGKVVSGALDQQVYTGLSVLSDEGCTVDQRTGLSNCTSQLKAGSGIISFNYEHDMMEKPCLSLGDKVDLQVTEGGAAVVRRIYWAGGGA